MSVTTGRLVVPPRQQPCSSTRATAAGEHPQRHLQGWSGILQADAYGGYGKLYAIWPAILEAGCWAHARRKFFELADLAANVQRRRQNKTLMATSPLALEAIQRIDALFAIERDIHGLPPTSGGSERSRTADQRVGGLDAAGAGRALAPCRGRQGHGLPAQALGRLHPVPDDGRVCLSNNAAERALRGIALGRKAWLFAGSDRGGERAAVIYSLITTAKLNDVDPQAWLADVLGRIAGHPATRLDELMPWNWMPSATAARAA